MHVGIPWRRKRPIEEEEYQEKKRFLSEEFFNMRISHPRDVWVEKPTGTRGNQVENVDREEAMEEEQVTDGPLPPSIPEPASVPQRTSVSMESSALRMSSATVTITSDGDDTDVEELDVDTPAPRLARRRVPNNENGLALPHPFQRTSSSLVDDKVEEWIRESRQRLISEASSEPGSESSRALIVYSPLPLPGSANNDDDDAGGDFTPPSRVEENGVQCAGSETFELRSAAITEEAGVGDLRGKKQRRTGRGLAHSTDFETGVVSGDDGTEAMAIDEDETEAVHIPNGGDAPLPPTLTRLGMSRGRPTPHLTPECVAHARGSSSSSASSQEPGQDVAGPGSGDASSDRWNGW